MSIRKKKKIQKRKMTYSVYMKLIEVAIAVGMK
jgi:hypothetical protein